MPATLNTATQDALDRAVLAGMRARPQLPALSLVVVSQDTLAEAFTYLRDFAANSSHEDLLAEIDALHHGVTR